MVIARLAVLIAFAFPMAAAEEFTLASFDGRTIAGSMIRLQVPENRARRDSRTITVAAVRLPAKGEGSGAPIVFLSGGPGIGAITLARVPVYFSFFDELRAIGDVILIDQRGSGLSTPSLTCPEAPMPPGAFASDAALQRAIAAGIAQCAAHFRNEGADLTGYSTNEIVEDVEALRRELGVEKLRLLAFSYGSEIAWWQVQRHPSTIERVVFASTRGPDRLLKLPFVWDAQLDALGIRTQVAELVRKLDAEPRKTPVGDAGGIGLLMILRRDLSDGRSWPALKTLIEKMRAGDFTEFDERVQRMHKTLGTLNMMTFAVDCSSGWSTQRLRLTNEQAKTAIVRSVNLQWHPEICGLVTDASLRRFPRAKRQNIPALFVTGSLDVNAPPAEAQQLRRYFRESEHFIVPGAPHETLPMPDVQRVVREFLSRTTPR